MSSDDDDCIDPGERELFRAAVSEVRPLANDRRAPDAPRPPPRPVQREADEAAALAALASGALDDPHLELGEEISFAREGVQRRVLHRLRRGRYAVEAELDLHGMTLAQAAPALADFLGHARARRLGCVRIIHGKGRRSSNDGPVLKPAVATWLSRRREVLAFCTARPVDGGSGAMYVLLGRG